MRKLKLLMAACALMMGSINADAREDVTSTYLTDAALEDENTNWALVSNGGNHEWNGTNKYHESWHNTFTLTQTTAALPAGYYQLSIQAAVEGGNSTTISLQATSGGNTSVAAYPKYSTADSYANMAAWWAADFTGTGNRNLNRIYTTVYVEEGQTLTATFKQTNAGQWFVYGQMQLHKLTDAEGRYAQMFEAVYNPMTNQDLASGRFKQRFEYYTEATVPAKTLNKTISSLPNGYYNVTFNGSASYTSGRGYSGNTGDNLTYFFANNITTNVTVVDRTNVGNSEFVDYTASNALVSDGNLEFGYSNVAIGANWFTGSVKMIEYLGGCVAADAVALPVSGDMAADTWYYFDIVVAGSDYNATATTLGDIVCTSDGTQLSASATGEVSLTATANSLTATRYYVKSSSANNLVVAAASYSYSVGSAAADISYIQPGNTVTVAYADLSTNDPGATLAKNFSGVTFGGNAIDVTPTANGFTFTVPANLANSTEFILSIPANAIGYEAGATYNAAQNITLTTTAVYDGIYYFFNTDSKKYMSRGDAWATRAITDDYGLPAYLAFDGQGHTKVKFFDNNLYLSEGGWLYTDKDNATGGTFMVEAVAGGYKFKDVSTSKYVALYDGYLVGDAVEGDNLQGSSNIWALETPAVYKDKDNAAALADAQAAVAASAAGFVGITTKTALESELTANYGMTKITITGAKAEKFQENASGDGENYGALKENVYYSETVNGLKPGLYKLSVDAFQRAASNDAVRDASGARSLIYVFAGSAKTQLKSWMDYGSVDAYSNDYAYDGKHYPNNEASAYAALETGNYTNDVYVYVADAGEGTGSLTFGIKNPQNAGKNALWSVYENFTLTLYEPKATSSEKKALADAIDAAEGNILGFEENEYAPYNNVAAVEVLAAAKAIDAETATGVAVVEATSALTSAVWTKNDAAIAEALYDGTLKLAPIQATAENVALPGWVAKSGNLRQTFNDAEQKPCLAGATDGVGLFVHPGTYVYGETTGYTMPLKANTVYVAEAKYCGWSGDSNKGFSLSIGGASKEFGANANDVTKADALKSVKLYFKTQEAGNYLLTVTVSGNTFMTDFSVRQSTDVETVTITSAGYATYCSENALDFSTTGLTVYTAAVVGDEVSFTELGDGIVPAGQGVLLKGDAKSYDVPVTVTNASLTNAFIGVNVASEEAAGIFVLMNGTKGVGFYKTKNAFTVGAHTAYLSAAVAPTRSFIGFDEEITGIKNLKTVEGQDVIFDLSGRRVLKAQKGLYIINGKKVVK